MSDTLTKETGDLSIHTENILPIIKKWLYSDHEIFIRELVSNSTDAILKLNHLSGIGEFKGEVGDNKIEILIDKEKSTITIRDNGVGMDADEIKKYINQIAFSGAEEFLQKYKKDDENSQIIGHFGLGFYSAYMVADLVEIHTLSHKENSQAVHWTCDGSKTYEIEGSDKKTVGTDVILHVNEDNKEFLDEAKIKELLNKYCKYYQVPIVIHETIEKTDEKDDKKKITEEVETQINDTAPIWTKKPNELKDEEYLDFYRKEYPYKEDPLFWIHINVDFPFNLNGILFFPKLRNDFDIQKSEISLYCNQVFVTDQTQELIPEYLHLLQGVIDSPDIPLNVSRSYLQSDARVKKIATHVTKKVADKLKGIFNTERENFEKYWDDIHPFIKYGMIKDDEFNKKVQDIILMKSTTGKLYTLNEYKEKFIGTNVDKNNKTVILYTSDKKAQATYLHDVTSKGYEVVVFDHMIDPHFISLLERTMDDFKFTRIDSNTPDKLIEKEDSEEQKVNEKDLKFFESTFKKVLKNDKLNIKIENMSNKNTSAVLIQSEEQRRMMEMMRMMNPTGSDTDMFNSDTIVLNTGNALVKKIKKEYESDKKLTEMLIQHVFDLASMAQKPLDGERLKDFLERSNKLLVKIQ